MSFFRRKRRLVSSHIFQLGVITSIYWMAMAMVETVWAVYMEGLLGSASAVGMAVGVLTTVGIVTAFLAPKLLAKAKDTQVYGFSLLAIAVGYLVFAFTNDFVLFFVVAVALEVASILRTSTIGILIRDESKEKELDKNTGFIYMMSNGGAVLGPLAAGYFSEAMGVQSVFVLVAVFVLIAFVRFKYSGIKDAQHHTKIRPVFSNLKRFAEPKLLKAYVVNGGIEAWWAISYIFVPLMLIGRGYSIGWIGLIIFASNLPLIVLEYPLMKKIRRIGYHVYFAIGYAGLALVSLALLFFNEPHYLLVIYAASAIPIAFLEPAREIYFFRLVSKKEEENLYAPYLTAGSVFYAASAFAFAIVLEAASFGAVYAVGAVALAAFAAIGLTARDAKN